MSGSASTSSCRTSGPIRPRRSSGIPVLTLTWAAACTSRVGLGTSVLVLPMRHPLPLAKELATLQNLSEGRLILGAGVGWLEDEFEALGVPFRERGRRMDEGIAMMRAVWTDDPVSFAAKYIPAVIDNMRILPKPEKPIPIWIGGTSEPALKRAARLDGWHGSRATPEQAAPFVERLREDAPGTRIRDLAALRLGRPRRRRLARPARRLCRGRGRPRAGRALGPRTPRLARHRRAHRPRRRGDAVVTGGYPPSHAAMGPSLPAAGEGCWRSFAGTPPPLAGEGWGGGTAMKLSTTIKFSPGYAGIEMDLVWEAERLGFDAVWAGEAYGTDAVSPIAWVLARTSRIKAGTSIMQMPARTPACAAMTAMTLQALSGNRFLCGIGPSGPQVVEGWHGVPFGKPLARTREYAAIIRQALERKGPLEFHGEHYDIPYTGPGSTGLAQAVAQHHPRRPEPQDLHRLGLAGRAAHRRRGRRRRAALFHVAGEGRGDRRARSSEGRAKAGKSRDLADFDNAPYVRVSMGDDLAKCRDALRPGLAFYIGGMGARDANFYNDLTKRIGYEAAAAEHPEPVSRRQARRSRRRGARRADRRNLADRPARPHPRPPAGLAGHRRQAGSAPWCWSAPTSRRCA